MTRSERSRRLEQAADAAAERAEQARLRIAEIEERLRNLHAVPLNNAADAEQVSRARLAAISAKAHSVESYQRARRAHEEAAEVHDAAAMAHDAAAVAHERLAATGLGDVEAHVRLAGEHRQLAAADRAGADLERGRLRELDEGAGDGSLSRGELSRGETLA